MLDLHSWLNEEYVLSRPIDPERDQEAIEEALRDAPTPPPDEVH